MQRTDTNSEQAILKAAEQEFLEKGFAAAKTTQIAAAAGVTHAMLHYYFRTKENLFNRVFEQKFELLRQSVRLFFENSALPLPERIQKAMEAHFDFLMENPDMPRFVINEIVSNPARQQLLKDAVSVIAFQALGNVQQELDDQAAKGKIHPVKAIDLLIDAVSLNAFVFVMLPVARLFAIPFYGGEREFLEARKRENIETILLRLLKNK